jgi:TolB protein
MTATPTGVAAALTDSVGAVRAQRDFALVSVPPLRDSLIADSLGRALAQRDSVRQAVLTRARAFRDSLNALLAKKPPHFWTSGARRKYDERVAALRAQVAASVAQDSVIFAEAQRDTVVRDSTRASLVARDSVLRDSLSAERRWAIHGVADALHEWITTRPGIAQSRIAYSADDGSLHLVDFDGANDHVVVRAARRVKALSPAWRHDGREIAFSELADAGTQIAQVDLTTGAVRYSTATPRGLNITPVYSPDDRWLVFATAAGAGTRLVAMRADSGTELHPVQTVRGYDATEPTFSPDGARIAYVTPRGRPQIFSVSRDGGGDRAELPPSKGKAPYRTGPDWSPDGRLIAFQQQNGLFQVWVLELATKQLRRLTQSGQNEDPSWAPDSRHVAITSDRAGERAIWILDVPTGRIRRVSAVAGRLAAWSPRLPLAF